MLFLARCYISARFVFQRQSIGIVGRLSSLFYHTPPSITVLKPGQLPGIDEDLHLPPYELALSPSSASIWMSAACPYHGAQVNSSVDDNDLSESNLAIQFSRMFPENPRLFEEGIASLPRS